MNTGPTTFVSVEPTGKVFLSSSADDLRERGLTVAVHNDYRLHGEAHTFWLFIDESTGISYKGEGKTDTEALNKVRAQIDLLGITGLNTPQAQAAYKVACGYGILEGRAFALVDAMYKAFFPKVKSKKVPQVGSLMDAAPRSTTQGIQD